MKPRVSNRKTVALTRIEALVIVAIVAMLTVLLLLWLSASLKKAKKITCVNHLCQVGLSSRIWAGDHKDLYPMCVSTNVGGTLEYVQSGQTFRLFQVMSNELSTPIILICPADGRRAAKDFASTLSNTNISYFLGIDVSEMLPQAMLSGDDNFAIGGDPVKPGLLALTTNTQIGWTAARHDRCGNVGLADGSVQSANNSNLLIYFSQTGLVTNRLAIP